MVKKIFFFAVVYFTLSCSSEKKESDIFLDINNKVLEREIIAYDQYTKSINKDKSYVICVNCLTINDSTSRYVIEGIISPSMIKHFPYNFKCKINNKVVFFRMIAGMVKNDWSRRNFFKIKEEAYLEFMEKYFPKDYRFFIKHKMTQLPDTYDEENCYLTFIHDKLVKKEMKVGLVWD